MLANRAARGTDSRARAPRFEVTDAVQVQSRTIGTDVSYSLSTKNVSRSGLLLTWEQNSRVPFIENTIIEMTIDPNCQLLHEPVHCLGKVVRRVQRPMMGGNAANTAEFGVRIVQIDNRDLDVWESCIDELTRSSDGVVMEEKLDMIEDLQTVLAKKRRNAA